MIQLVDYFSWYRGRSEEFKRKPWLVLGKGPTFRNAKNFDIHGFNLFGLNHTILELKVDVVHVIDVDVIDTCGQRLRENARFLVMPWYPHVKNKPGKKSLIELVKEVPMLGQLAAEGRLLWYNKTGSSPHGDSPPVRVVYFSAEAAFRLLGMSGVRVIRTLGIDGGVAYSGHFKDLGTLLSNGRSSFDRQFAEIARAIMDYQLDAAPLGVLAPIKVYVATMAEQILAVKVLEYSIKKHASMSVEVLPMHLAGNEIPRPVDAKNWPRTPFSFQRFIIPQHAGYKGRAIYLDSDMQVFGDIKGLWSWDMEDNELLSVAAQPGSGRKPQYSVMLMDCEKLQWSVVDIVEGLNEGNYSYEDLMYRMCVAQRQAPLIPAEWNSLETYTEGKTNLIHYTDMNTQPWVYAKHTLGYLWVRDLLEAIDRDFISIDEVLDHVKKGWVRPSLAYQIEHIVEDAFLLPRSILSLDKNYSPPYHKLHRHESSPWTSPWYYGKALARHLVAHTPVLMLMRRLKNRLTV